MSVEKVKAVILVDGVDLGRCSLGSQLPRALWSMGDGTVLGNLIEQLAGQGVRDVAVCCNSESRQVVEEASRGEGLDIRYIAEDVPRGDGGRLFDAAGDGDELLLALNCNVISVPDITEIANNHIAAKADMTIGFGPDDHGGSLAGDSSQVYLFERSVLEHIPDIGYCDIKEGLIPQLVTAGKKIHAFTLASDPGSFKSWREYLGAALDFVDEKRRKETAGSGEVEERRSGGGRVDESARVIGAVVVCDGVQIDEDAVIIGPAIIGPNVRIGRGATVVESVLWEGSRIGNGSVVQGCLLDCGVRVADNRTAEGELLTRKFGVFGRVVDKGLVWLDRLKASVNSSFETIIESMPNSVKEVLLMKSLFVWIASGIVVMCFLASYWEPTIKELWQIWMGSDEYSSGLLVPFLAGYILWSQRKGLSGCMIKPCMWGLAVFAGAQAMRFFGLWIGSGSADRLSLMLTVIALTLLVLGWRLIWRIAPVLLYLFFMMPLPNSVQLWITQPLQRWATTSAVFGLEMLGYDVVREGNVINLNGTMVAVAEACNGLRMLTAFFVISGLVALLVHRKWWEKIIIFASSIPIAFACNTLRLIITAIAFTKLDTEHWEKVFHDFGGLAMMPLALGIIVLELWLLSNLLVQHEEDSKEISTSLVIENTRKLE